MTTTIPQHLRYVIPPFTTDDLTDNARADAILPTQFGVSDAVHPVGVPNRTHINLGEFRVPRTLAASHPLGMQTARVTVAAQRAPAKTHILHIISMRAECQMVRANAQRVIATMANHETHRDWSHQEFVRIAMGIGRTAWARVKASVSHRTPCYPQPTRGGLVDFLPEPFGRWARAIAARYGIVRVHDLTSLQVGECHASGGVSDRAEALSYSNYTIERGAI